MNPETFAQTVIDYNRKVEVVRLTSNNRLYFDWMYKDLGEVGSRLPEYPTALAEARRNGNTRPDRTIAINLAEEYIRDEKIYRKVKSIIKAHLLNATA